MTTVDISLKVVLDRISRDSLLLAPLELSHHQTAGFPSKHLAMHGQEELAFEGVF